MYRGCVYPDAIFFQGSPVIFFKKYFFLEFYFARVRVEIKKIDEMGDTMKHIVLMGVACVLLNMWCGAGSVDQCLRARRDERVRAFLDVIAYAEGTYLYGVLGYSARFPMRWFNGFGQHPGFISVKKRSGEVTKYSASGRYMFLIKTWEYLAKKLNLDDFGPLNQDVAAIALLVEKGALAALQSNNFERAVLLANKTWATFPGSPYGQTTTTMPELKRLYQDRLVYYRGGGVL